MAPGLLQAVVMRSAVILSAVLSSVAAQDNLQPCGDAFYDPSKYTCYDSAVLCPVLSAGKTLSCGDACYLPQLYGCSNGNLVYEPELSPSSTTLATHTVIPTSATVVSSPTGTTPAGCSETATTFHLSDPPYEDYFYSDCHSAAQVVVTSPQPHSNLTLIGPRLLVAWPAGNSGIVSFFAPQNGKNGSLTLAIANLPDGSNSIQPVFEPAASNSLTGNPVVGVTGLLTFNSTAVLVVPILGSVRTIRDFTEGPSILVPEIQDAINFTLSDDGEGKLARMWLDNKTVTSLTFTPTGSSGGISLHNRTMTFKAGTYAFNASFDYLQLEQLSQAEVFAKSSAGLITQQPNHTKSVSFLSYTNKLLAGGWRFLTYFGRDTMISLLLMQPVLSEGEGGAIEAVISAVLERINSTDGSVCHEETIGDYATYLNQIDFNISSTKPQCSYIMIDTDYYLPLVTKNYFLDTATGRSRQTAFWTQHATSNFGNKGTVYTALLQLTAERIMNHAQAFAAPGGQTKANLRHIEPTQIVGEWRDSTYGIGGGRIPFDVNSALVPAALRAIASLAQAGFFPKHKNWGTLANSYAKVWEDHSLAFFEVAVNASAAKSLVNTYVKRAAFTGPTHTNLIPSQGLTYHGLSLDGNNNQTLVEVMNTDACFRLYLLNTTNQAQLTAFLNATATSIQLPFPAGLSTPLGLVVANPAYGTSPVYAANWTTSAYHGTVIWSWQLAMMAAGLERQLGRCEPGGDKPDYCKQTAVYGNVKGAYNHLWGLIESNTQYLTNEVWSWTYKNGFQFTALGALSATESDIIQLWSLTFLSVKRNDAFQ